MTDRMIAYVQMLMMSACRLRGRFAPGTLFYERLERLEAYLIRRSNRGVFEPAQQP